MIPSKAFQRTDFIHLHLDDCWIPDARTFLNSKFRRRESFINQANQDCYTISKPFSRFGFSRWPTLAEPVGHGHQHTVDNLDLL
jgi:hypothetical protein